MNKKRIGYFGGCFNPVTVAHVNLIKKAIEQCNLDKVYFVPMNDFYLKENLVPAQKRLEMLKIACASEKKIEVSSLAIDLDKPTKAIDMFEIINNKHKDSDNYFIMGSDNFEKISTWKSAEKLERFYKYIVLDRGIQNIDLSNKDIILVKDDLSNNISSSLVRKRIKENQSTDNLIIDDIKAYILKNNLYK